MNPVQPPTKTALRAGVITAGAILLSLLIWAVVQYLVIPGLSEGWQQFVVWAGAVVLWIVSVLAGASQFTGYNLKELISPAAASGPERHGSGLLTGGAVDILVKEIQKSLYGDDNQLPYVLTLCIDLCHRLGLPRDYLEWLGRELNGFEDMETLAKVLGGGDADNLDEWMKSWASHRFVKTYVKMQYISADTKLPVMDELPYERIFMAQSLAQIIEMKRECSAWNSTGEIGVPLAKLGKDKFEVLKAFVASSDVQMRVPDDIQVFFTVGALKVLLTGVRKQVLSLLGVARVPSNSHE